MHNAWHRGVRPVVVRRARLAAALTLCVCLAACTPLYYNDVRKGVLNTELESKRTQIAFGLDASLGPLEVVLALDDDALNAKSRSCAVARAKTPEGSTGVTYFVFDVPPGTYVPVGMMDSYGTEQPAFVARAREQVYVGTFTLGPVEEWEPPFDFAPGKRPLSLKRDLETAKAALGAKAKGLELAETTSGVIKPLNAIGSCY
jgi:hypothetical protein